jgi:hypothetical protein
MAPIEEYGWHDERSCPPWCTVTDHVDFRINHGMDDFWHGGPTTRLKSEDEGTDYAGIYIEVGLTQKVQSDERGCFTHLAQVAIDGAGYTPANARRLAGLLMELADQADADTEWRRSQGFNLGPKR